METPETLRLEVAQKIGRNVLLFQKLELILKFLLACGNLSGYALELNESYERRKAAVGRQTMGQLAGRLAEIVSSDSDEPASAPEDLNDLWISFGFKVQADSTYYHELKEAFAAVVSDRNELIHHFPLKFDLSSAESALAASQYLDEQHEKVQPMLTRVQVFGKALREGRKNIAAFFDSDAGKRYVDLWYGRGQPVVPMLSDFATEKAGPDGWADLSQAGQVIEKNAPGEIAALKKHYGQRTLKGLLLAAELFDVREEPTAKGGLRVLYRERSEWVWQVKDSD